MRWLRLDSIRQRLLLFAVMATLAPSLSTAWISYEQHRRASAARIRDNLARASNQTAREVELWLKERLLDLRVFASSYEVSENLERMLRGSAPAAGRLADTPRLGEYLNSVRSRLTVYQDLFVIDLRGRVVASTGRTVPPLTGTWQTDLAASNFLVLESHRDRAPGPALITVAVPVSGPGARLLGALGATLDLGALSPTLDRGRPDTAGRILLVAQDGDVIAATGWSRDPAPSLEPAVAADLRNRLETQRAAEYRSVDGRRVIGRARALEHPPWLVVAELPADEAFREVNRLRNMTLLVVLVVLGVVGLAAWHLAHHIVRPLDSLTAGATKVASGDLSVDLPITGGGEVAYLTKVFNNMVARVRESRQELERLSITDSLTGLYNRRHLMSSLEQEVRRVKRQGGTFALLMMDIDHFKRFNDTHGHQAGDDALIGVAGAIRGSLREVDWAARYGGEELVAVLPDTELDGAVEVAERIRSRLADTEFSGEKITLSIGVATFPDCGDTPEALIASADAALYQAKREGRDRVARARRRKTREVRSR
jgi:diguanylate cyclase (GGDEF)-like protein